MSGDQVKAKWFRYRDAINQRDLDLLDRVADELFTADVVYHAPGMVYAGSGRVAQKANMRAAIAASPDFHLQIDELLSDGDRVIARVTVLTNDPTTGAVQSNVCLEIDRVVDGKVAEGWNLMAPGTW